MANKDERGSIFNDPSAGNVEWNMSAEAKQELTSVLTQMMKDQKKKVVKQTQKKKGVK